ncbi:MAG: hypothetical protein H0X26_01620 [Alphaproteobacteria bacterium]|nr:hypothetical protein [Alphaproteobacteria bacterium]
MKKITFKNPQGGTIYLAKVGFDWGAFWAMFAFGGLPFFLRRMNVLGAYCLGWYLIMALSMGFVDINSDFSSLEKSSTAICYLLIIFFISLYLGSRGGKLTARHYVEEGYTCVSKDDALVARAKAKWGMEF